MLTSKGFGDLLDALSQKNDFGEVEKYNVLRSLEDYQKNKKLSPEFVETMTKQTSECFNAWIDARRKNDYSVFAPALKRMIALKQQQAALYGYEGHPYNALLDDYESGATVAMLDPVFEGIKEQLPVLLNKIKSAPQVSNDCYDQQYFPRSSSNGIFGIDVLKRMGFDFDAGRQDYSEHPFTTSFAPADVRITTRVDENNYASMLWSCIHEGGHALYEQGLPEEQYGLPLGSACSLGIHESQSRFWENCVGRSTNFWNHFFPRLKQLFPEQFVKVTAEDFFKTANRVEPSLIRTEADEITYHFHVLIRYEIEKELIAGTLAPGGIRDTWNKLYDKYLGVTPDTDKTGVLQDVHWSHGSFGYFPTYTLGSFYAAQFYDQAQKEIPAFAQNVESGTFAPILAWLREKIHRHGRRYKSEELCELVTGQKLNPAYFLAYAEKKYAQVYGIK